MHCARGLSGGPFSGFYLCASGKFYKLFNRNLLEDYSNPRIIRAEVFPTKMNAVTKINSLKGRRRSAGFTLAEIAIATMVIGLVMASSMTGLRMGFALIETARYNTLASQILQSEMENLRLKNWSDIAALQDGNFEMDPSFQGTQAEKFTTTRSVEDVSTSLCKITLEVQWAAFNGATLSRRYVTFFSKDGLNDYYYRSFR